MKHMRTQQTSLYTHCVVPLPWVHYRGRHAACAKRDRTKTWAQRFGIKASWSASRRLGRHSKHGVWFRTSGPGGVPKPNATFAIPAQHAPRLECDWGSPRFPRLTFALLAADPSAPLCNRREWRRHLCLQWLGLWRGRCNGGYVW